MTKVVEWFGFKLHLLVDVKHEVWLDHQITDTKAGDRKELWARGGWARLQKRYMAK